MNPTTSLEKAEMPYFNSMPGRSLPQIYIFFFVIIVACTCIIRLQSEAHSTESGFAVHGDTGNLNRTSSISIFPDDDVRWIQHQRELSLNLTFQEEPLRLYYRTMAGIGHQFMRIAAAYHLANIYKIPRLHLTANPMCGGSIFTTYNYLIGEGPIIVDRPFSKVGKPETFPNLTMENTANMTEDTMSSFKANPSINNNVPGYLPGDYLQ